LELPGGGGGGRKFGGLKLELDDDELELEELGDLELPGGGGGGREIDGLELPDGGGGGRKLGGLLPVSLPINGRLPGPELLPCLLKMFIL
jgi:hypothetical protein